MGARDEPYAAFVAAYRDRLVGTADLVHLDPARAPAVVDAALARTYADWPRLDDPYAFALRLVLDPALPASDRPAPGFTLVDVPSSDARPADLRSALATLTADERRIVVLADYTLLPTADIARVLGRDRGDVETQLRAAVDRLTAMSPGADRRVLRSALAASAVAVPTPVGGPPSAGRTLVRARRLRWAAVAACLVVLAVVAVRLVAPSTSSVASDDPTIPASPKPTCDTTQADCRAALITDWGSQIADVVHEHLDAEHGYFSDVRFSETTDRIDPGFWAGGPGVFDVHLSRGGGATEVYLQIATSRTYAVQCGSITKRPCSSQKFMDGNRFLLNDPYDVAHGLEVQYRPAGTYVITVVARNISTSGRQLALTRGDLMNLITDPRLQLPPR